MCVRLTSLRLEQFRNHAALSLAFTPQPMQLFYGANGSGKTNILESVGMLALTKSFLSVEEDDVRTWGTEFYRVTGNVVSDAGEQKELEIVSQILPRRQKACFCNGVRVGLNHLIGQLPVVVFLPQDLSLFTGSPAERRRALDQILCQVSPHYFTALLDYQRILKQRNTLLKAIKDGNASAEQLDTWDNALALQGSAITLLRLELTEVFTLSLPAEIHALGESWTDVSIRYKRSGEARGQEELAQELTELFLRNRQRDILLQSTLSGPHRDDWEILADGRPLQAFASRGQQRIALLALLFLETSFLELRRGEKPVILLDDIFSELDGMHRERVSHAFRDHQVLLTATDLPPGLGDAVVWPMEEIAPKKQETKKMPIDQLVNDQ